MAIKSKLTYSQNLLLLFFALTIILGGLYYLNSKTANYKSDYFEIDVSQEAKIRMFESREQLVEDCKSNKAYITLVAWQLMNAIEKKDFTKYLAERCANKNKSTDLNIQLVDLNTAKTIATFDGKDFVVY